MRTFNYSALKNFKWDSEILGYVAKINEHKGRQELYLKQKPAILNKLVDIAKIQSTESSNQIEGIITTSARMKKLLTDKTTPQNRDEEEIMGYRDVLNTIHKNYEYMPIRPSLILQLHRDLYSYSQKGIGGRYKNSQNFVIKTDSEQMEKIRFTPLPPYETADAIESICESFNIAIDADIIDSLVIIPIFIFDFLCIHPFSDGNGRMSRLLTTLLFYRSGYVVGKYISIESKIEKTKARYYNILEQCGVGWHDGENDPVPFIKYILGIILAAYRDFENRFEITDEKILAIDQVRNAIDKKIGKFTKGDIMEVTPSISESSVRSSLKKLVDEGYIKRHGENKNTFYTRV